MLGATHVVVAHGLDYVSAAGHECSLLSPLGVAQQTVRRWGEKGYLAGAQRIGTGHRSAWVIPEDALEGFWRPKPGRPYDRG